jgi:large subunit ribosomal protein L17
MRHRMGNKKLGRDSGQRKALLRGLVRSVLVHERIQTTEPKAKAARPEVERLITLGRHALQAMDDGDTPENRAAALHYRRMAMAYLPDRDVVAKVFGDWTESYRNREGGIKESLAERYRDRPGGYTRILKVGQRKGDAAPMALLELV